MGECADEREVARVRRRVLIMVMALVAMSTVPAHAADEPFEGRLYGTCDELNGTQRLVAQMYFTITDAEAGDVLTVLVDHPSVGSPENFVLEKKVLGVWVEIPHAPGIPGEVTLYAYGGEWYLGIHGGTRAATVTIRCGADSDGDGVFDVDDLCSDTVLPDAFPNLKANRFSADASGVLSSAKSSRAYTVEHTGGCSATQIIEQMQLGKGHARYGISHSALKSWIASVGAG